MNLFMKKEKDQNWWGGMKTRHWGGLRLFWLVLAVCPEAQLNVIGDVIGSEICQ